MDKCPKCDAKFSCDPYVDDGYTARYWKCGSRDWKFDGDDKPEFTQSLECAQAEVARLTARLKEVEPTLDLFRKPAINDQNVCTRCGVYGGHSVAMCATYLQQQKLKLVAFVKTIRDGFDCDGDGHKYGTHCRCCDASKLLNDLAVDELAAALTPTLETDRDA